MDKNQDKIKKLTIEVSALTTKLSLARSDNELLRWELNESQSQIAGAEAAAQETVQDRLAAAEARASGSDKLAGELQNQLDAMTAERDEARAKLQTEQDEHRTIQRRVLATKAKLNEIIPGFVR